MADLTFTTKRGVTVERARKDAPFDTASDDLIAQLDTQRGAMFASNYEYPGRYNRWQFGFVNPPVAIEARNRTVRLRALNPRGAILIEMMRPALDDLEAIAQLAETDDGLQAEVRTPDRVFNEDERSRMPSVFSVLRAISDVFHTEEDAISASTVRSAMIWRFSSSRST